MEITYDWCISRQLWWGHRIPAWYKGEEVYVGINPPEGEGWVQDSDVLDTWFSSALWPFSTLGWPEKTDLLARYYPNNVLVTGYDIIPFWVNRMTFQGLHFTDQRPFKDCLIHGLIRDKQGRKMSKSLGNGVDPMDVIEKYGCDSLRFFLTTSTAPGMDLRYDEEKVASTWNFINKLWNASRFVLMNIEDLTKDTYTLDNLSISDKWILTKLENLIKTVRKHMDNYEFNVVGTELYGFIWNDFCDWYIELAKGNMNNTTKSVLLTVLTDILKMLHPFMPYVTEEIYLMLPLHDESIMISSYPEYNKDLVFTEKPNNMGLLLGTVKKFNPEKGHIDISANEILSIGDTISLEKESGTYTISELMVGNSNIEESLPFQPVTIGRMKGNISVGDKVYKMSSKELTRISLDSINKENIKKGFDCILKIKKDEPITMTVINTTDDPDDVFSNIYFTITSPVKPVSAINAPITHERVISQITKTKNTPFYFEHIEIDLDDNIFIPSIGCLNELRRTAIEKIETVAQNRFSRELHTNLLPISFNNNDSSKKVKKSIAVLFNNFNRYFDYSLLEKIDKILMY